MGGTTPNLALPYPTGTDRLMDGDNAIQSLATTLDTYLVKRNVPVGALVMWPAAAAPTGWLICNGGTFDSGTYGALATLLGDTYGVHSGSTYFLPDFRVRLPVGVGTGKALAANDAVAEASRNANHAHAHTHPGPPDHNEAQNTTATGSQSRVTSGNHGTVPSGGPAAHPFLAVNFIIKAT